VKGLRNWPLLLIVLVASVLILILGWTGTLRPAENAASTVLVPIQYTVQRLVRGLAGVATIPHDLQTLRTENRRLQAQNDELSSQLIVAREIEVENANLRELLNLKQQSPEVLGPGADLLFAEVIGRDPNTLLYYLTIDRGSQDGIKPGMPVITARGLVGQISEVTPSSSKVKLVVDPSSQVIALVQRTRATGVVQGEDMGANLAMTNLAQKEDVARPGDLVVTSGLGGKFPRWLPIGQIIDVQRRDVEMFQTARVQPAVDYARLETVIVVRHFTPIGADSQADSGTETAAGAR
jgi:rod shape-determining protein MreC